MPLIVTGECWLSNWPCRSILATASAEVDSDLMWPLSASMLAWKLGWIERSEKLIVAFSSSTVPMRSGNGAAAVFSAWFTAGVLPAVGAVASSRVRLSEPSSPMATCAYGRRRRIWPMLSESGPSASAMPLACRRCQLSTSRLLAASASASESSDSSPSKRIAGCMALATCTRPLPSMLPDFSSRFG
jgi:hypothetical protein